MIVGVAIKNEIMMISLPKPARHCDCFLYLIEQFGRKKGTKIARNMHGKNQGFITDKGIYLDRFQAMRHVKRCKQKLLDCEHATHQWNHPLFSEDLW